jgi:hypothetical protein
MGRRRGIAIVGIVALMVVPAIGLAHGVEKPAAGPWVPYESSETDVALGNFTITGSAVTSLTFAVTSDSGENPGCPTGSVSVSSPVGLKLYKFAGSRPFWGFGKIGHRPAPKGIRPAKVFEAAPVTATLDGQPVKGAKLSMEFVAADTEGIKGDSSGGGFDFTPKCQVTLSENISQSENAGTS